jgi:PIN domain nuclease of toxin-antitoxin system
VILLDTCAIIWDGLDQGKLTKKALQAVETASNQNALLVSDISFWEIAMLVNKGRIAFPTKAAYFIQLFLKARNPVVIPISPEIAELSANLPPELNNDPADRIIAATAILHNARLVTADDNLLQCNFVDTLW